MSKVFNFKESHYSLRNNDCVINRNTRTVLYGTFFVIELYLLVLFLSQKISKLLTYDY